MNEITLATANIYWYGLAKSVALSRNLNIGFFHATSDDLRLASMLSSIGADIFCFQEIVDVERFEKVLAKAHTAFRMRDEGGQVVSSTPVSMTQDARQRVVLAWNEALFSLVNWQRLSMWTRAPILAEFEHRPTGRRLHVIGVHAKSSAPEAEDEAGQLKRKELDKLAEWATHETGEGRLAEALILGDLNSMLGGEDASHLQSGAMADWHWREATGEKDSHWTTTTDQVVIDHALVSPRLAERVTRWPEIVYFDRDPNVQGPSPQQVLAKGILKNLTDHRPVRITLDLGD